MFPEIERSGWWAVLVVVAVAGLFWVKTAMHFLRRGARVISSYEGNGKLRRRYRLASREEVVLIAQDHSPIFQLLDDGRLLLDIKKPLCESEEVLKVFGERSSIAASIQDRRRTFIHAIDHTILAQPDVKSLEAYLVARLQTT